MSDPDEDIWVRRHIPATLSRMIPRRSQSTCWSPGAEGTRRLPALQGHRGARAVAARQPTLVVPHEAAIEPLVVREGSGISTSLSLHHNLFVPASCRPDTLLARALEQKMSAHARSDLPPAVADLSVEGHRRRPVDAAHGDLARRVQRIGIPRQHPDRPARQRVMPRPRGSAARGKGPARNVLLQDALARHRGNAARI